MNILFIVLRTGHNSYRNFFPLGIAYLVSSLREINVEPDLLSLDVFDFSEREIAFLLKQKQYHLICLGFLFDNTLEAVSLIKIIRSVSPKSLILTGGAGPSSCPEYTLRKTGADILARGEAEITIKKLVTALSSSQSPENVAGLYINTNGRIKNTGPEEIYENLSDCPLPAWDKFPMELYLKNARPPATQENNYMCVLTSRGCPYECNFCFNTNKFRLREVEDVVHEIKLLKEYYYADFIQFYDELFMSSKKRTLSLCNAFLKENLNIQYRINGRVNIVDEEIIEALKESGCVAVGYGVESGDQRILDFMKKKTKLAQIHHAVNITKKAGLCVTTPVIFGQPGENLQTLNKTKNLVMQFTDGHEEGPRLIRPLTPYPGTPIYKWAVKKGYLKNEEDLLQRFQHAEKFSVNLTQLNDDKFIYELDRANKEISQTFLELKKEKACLY